jgi:hypothetical protein
VIATIAALDVDHETARPVTTAPALSSAVAANAAVAPTKIEAAGDVTETLATAGRDDPVDESEPPQAARARVGRTARRRGSISVS